MNKDKYSLLKLVMLCLMSACLGSAWGGALSDPTRPHPAWLAEHPEMRSADEVSGAEKSSGGQMMLIGKSRTLAVIDGQVVKPGDRYQDTSVLAIKPDAVEMKDASKSVKLASTVEKRVIAPALPKNAGKASSKRKARTNGDGVKR